MITLLFSALDERLSLVDAKSVLSFFAERIPRIDRLIVKDVCHFALTNIQPRIVSFEEQVILRFKHNVHYVHV